MAAINGFSAGLKALRDGEKKKSSGSVFITIIVRWNGGPGGSFEFVSRQLVSVTCGVVSPHVLSAYSAGAGSQLVQLFRYFPSPSRGGELISKRRTYARKKEGANIKRSAARSKEHTINSDLQAFLAFPERPPFAPTHTHTEKEQLQRHDVATVDLTTNQEASKLIIAKSVGWAK